jgi:uncharacterized phage-associated protein
VAFNVRKAAQVIAYLARERGGSINFITVVKLAYLSDRRALELYDLPILNDEFVSMEHGPVNSTTYNYLKGRGRRDADIWSSYVETISEINEVTLVRDRVEDDFDELSDAEAKILKEVAAKYKGMRPFELVDYVHKNCAEWENVGQTSKPLPYERVFSALGKKNIEALSDHITEYRNLSDAVNVAR